jgi:hypothetical protein
MTSNPKQCNFCTIRPRHDCPHLRSYTPRLSHYYILTKDKVWHGDLVLLIQAIVDHGLRASATLLGRLEQHN